MNEVIGYIFIIIGLGLNVCGCIGILRMPDVYNRLQATAKCVTLGTCSILLGTFIFKGLSATGMKAFLTMVFIMFTAPVSAHALAKAAHKSGVKLWEKSVCDKYAEDSHVNDKV
jgi:multicomponent Na+:H+ antiporter subunit G